MTSSDGGPRTSGTEYGSKLGISWYGPSLTITVFKLSGRFGKVALDHSKISRTESILLVFLSYEPKMKEVKLTRFCFLLRFAAFLSSLLIRGWLESGFGSVKKLQERSVRPGTSRSLIIGVESVRKYLNMKVNIKLIINSTQLRPRLFGTHYLWTGFLGVFLSVPITVPILKITLEGWFRARW